MSVGTWSSGARRFSSGQVHAVPVQWPRATPLRSRRQTVRTSEPWILLLAAVAWGLATYTVIQAATLTTAQPEQPGAPSSAAMSPAIAPSEAQQLEPSADRSGAEREIPAPPALSVALESRSIRTSPLYDRAAARYGLDPTMLRALHEVESTAASSGCTANRQGSGAMGPFQFKPATFRQYAVDADGDGRTDICAFADSLFSAARYLKALGADTNVASTRTHHALLRYGAPANRVVALATAASR